MVVLLVTSKANEVKVELEALLEDAAAEAVWLPLWMAHGDSDDNAGVNMDPVLVSRAVHLVLEELCDFERRVRAKVLQWPFLLTWMVARSPDVVCPVRLQTAIDFLAAQPGTDPSFNATCCKVRTLFLSCFQYSATTGLCTFQLHLFLTELFGMWTCDTQEVEGVNNIIKTIAKLAPNISWRLMASRVTVKKAAATCQSRDARTQLVNDAVSALPDSKGFHGDADRWAALDSSTNPPQAIQPEKRLHNFSALSKGAKWAARLTTALVGLVDLRPSTLVSYGLRVEYADGREGCFEMSHDLLAALYVEPSTWFVSHMFRSQRLIVKCNITRPGMADQKHRINLPVQSLPMITMLERLYNAIIAAPGPHHRFLVRINMFTLAWTDHSMNTASITGAVALHQVEVPLFYESMS